jgi:hypothetical protein
MTTDAWTDADDRAVAFLLTHTTPDGHARPARIDPDLSRLDRWDRAVRVDTPDFEPGDLGIVVMVALVILLVPTLVIAQLWRWLG